MRGEEKNEENKTTVELYETIQIDQTIEEQKNSYNIKVWKIILHTKEEKKEIILDKNEISVGRLPTNDIRIGDPKVSAKHCKFIIEENDLFIEDQNSTNGTFVNDNRISKRVKLKPGDKIIIGDTQIDILEEKFSPGVTTLEVVKTQTIATHKKVSKEDKEEKKEAKENSRKLKAPLPSSLLSRLPFIFYVLVSLFLILSSILSTSEIIRSELEKVVAEELNITQKLSKAYLYDQAINHIENLGRRIMDIKSIPDKEKIYTQIQNTISNIQKDKESKEKIEKAFKLMEQGEILEAEEFLNSISPGSRFQDYAGMMKEKIKEIFDNIVREQFEQLKATISSLSFSCESDCNFTHISDKFSILNKITPKLTQEKLNDLKRLNEEFNLKREECKKFLEQCKLAQHESEIYNSILSIIKQGKLSEAIEKIESLELKSPRIQDIREKIKRLLSIRNEFVKHTSSLQGDKMYNSYLNLTSTEEKYFGTRKFTESLIKELKDNLSKNCKELYDNKVYSEAYYYCSVAGKIDEKSENIKKIIEQKAEKILEECRIASKLNPKIAMKKCNEVKDYVPKFSNIYKEAESIIIKLK